MYVCVCVCVCIYICSICSLTLLHSVRPKLYGVLAVVGAIGLKETSTAPFYRHLNKEKNCAFLFASMDKMTF